MVTSSKSPRQAAHIVRAKARRNLSSGAPADEGRSIASPSEAKPAVAGVRLINLIRRTLQARGLPEREVIGILGITPIYWNSLTNGHRRIGSLPKDKMERLAEFLHFPVVQLYALAGHFSAEDFILRQDLAGQLDLSIDKMRGDPKWAALAPSASEWSALPVNVKIALTALYERECGRSLLRKVEVELPGLAVPPITR